jgi:alpha-beta hydrolase superfamily lysophospholipase
MGGNIGLYHRLYGKFRPKGYIISSPWIVLYNQLSGFTVASMKILSKFAPKLGIKSSINIKDLSSDQSMIPSEPDPLCHGYISVLTGVECYEGAKEILRNSSIEKEDLLLIHGSADNICSVEGSRLFMKNAPKSCTYVEFEGNYHELHYDKDRDRVAETVKNWVWERL